MRVIVIGGGPAGMLAAIAASKANNLHNEVFLIEKNEKLGKKLFITGKGRCNVTNDCDKDEFFKNIVRNSKFLYSAYNTFSNKDLETLIATNGCKLKVERGDRVFPNDDKAYSITDALKNAIKNQGVKVLLEHELKEIVAHDRVESVGVKDLRTGKIEHMAVDRLIIATGGLAYPSTGSTGDGYEFARSLNINVVRTSPSLVPLEVEEKEDCDKMTGLSLKNVAIKVYKSSDKKLVYQDFGEMTFESFGVDGPIILSASTILDFDVEKEYVLSIDLKPAIDHEKLDARLLREFDANRGKDLRTVCETLLPMSMIDVFLKRLHINNTNISDMTKEDRKEVVATLKNFRLVIKGKRSYDEAIITRGGVDVKEINPKTMESKKVKGLYFAGEVLDVDALTGGFNIQIAASTGYTAGLSE